jgi:hypothetical protein
MGLGRAGYGPGWADSARTGVSRVSSHVTGSVPHGLSPLAHGSRWTGRSSPWTDGVVYRGPCPPPPLFLQFTWTGCSQWSHLLPAVVLRHAGGPVETRQGGPSPPLNQVASCGGSTQSSLARSRRARWSGAAGTAVP